LQELLVAGSEKLPDGSTNPWNKEKSKRLLRFYDGEASSGEDSDNELSQTSRIRRLRVALAIGITSTQLNFAQLTI